MTTDKRYWLKDDDWELKYILPTFDISPEGFGEGNIDMIDSYIFINKDNKKLRFERNWSNIKKKYNLQEHKLIKKAESKPLESKSYFIKYTVNYDECYVKYDDYEINVVRIGDTCFDHSKNILPIGELTMSEWINIARGEHEVLEIQEGFQKLKQKLTDGTSLVQV